jgi:hypothetical protein
LVQCKILGEQIATLSCRAAGDRWIGAGLLVRT